MKKTVSRMILTLLMFGMLTLANNIQTVKSASNVLVNGDFETGTFDGWEMQGVCSISNTIVHNGSYSAYISDAPYDNSIEQVIYPRIRLPVDFGLTLEAWVYPSKVGLLRIGQYPLSGVIIYFCNVSSGVQHAFGVIYTWCMTCGYENWPGINFLTMNVSEWNFFSRNVTADFRSWLGNMDFSDIVLYSIEVLYHFSTESPGPFYVDDLRILTPPLPSITATVDIYPQTLNLRSKAKWINCYVELPGGYDVADINVSTTMLNDTVSAELHPTEVGDYDGDDIPDLMVKFNRTAVSEYILSKGIMTGNVTLTIIGQLNDGTLFQGSDIIRVRMPGDINIDGKVDLKDVYAVAKAFGSYSEHPRWNYIADENEDNKIDMRDIYLVLTNFGKTYP